MNVNPGIWVRQVLAAGEKAYGSMQMLHWRSGEELSNDTNEVVGFKGAIKGLKHFF